MPKSNPDIDGPGEEPLLPPSQRGFFLGPIPGTLHHPWVILAWQLLSVASAWIFITTLARNGDLPLSDALASLVNRYPSETIFIATLVATILSATTAWFFYAAIRQAVVPFLSQRVSLFQLCGALTFSMRSFVLSKRHPQWTVLTLLCVGLLGSLTSAWSSIITPTTFELDLQVTGQEIDISSLALRDFMGFFGGPIQSPQFSNFAQLTVAEDSLWDANLITAGVGSVVGGLGYTSIVSFVNDAYNISTGGIMPIDNPLIPATQPWASTAYGDIYPQVTPIGTNYYRGLSSNQTLNQQGLTANVSCRSQNLSDPTSFPYMVLSRFTFNTPVSGEDSPVSITSWSWNTTCFEGASSYMNLAFTSPLDDDQNNFPFTFLAGSICSLQSFTGASNQSFLIALQVFNQGIYTDSQLCEVTPLLTTVQVAYGGGVINIEKTLSSSTFDEIDPSGSMVNYIGELFGIAIYKAQASTITGNAILNSIDASIPSGHYIDITSVNWGRIFEDYWRGSVEGLITELRFSATLRLNSTQIPANMSLPVSGTMHVTTIGWKFSQLGSPVALLPITVIFILSVLALLLPRLSWHHAGSSPNSADERIVFDPSSIMSIIRASAAGGVSPFFQGLRHGPESAEDEEAHLLSIGFTDDNRIGFIESDAQSPGIPYQAQVGEKHV